MEVDGVVGEHPNGRIQNSVAVGNGEMQKQHPPQIRSVSDIYGTDEIDFLLEEIRDLEPACCQEDLQDFEIAGSRAGEIEISIATPLESPLGTCSSWDSHLNYRERLGQNQMGWGGVVLHCDASHLKTPTGIVRILLVVSKHILPPFTHVSTSYLSLSHFPSLLSCCTCTYILKVMIILSLFLRYHQLVAWRLNVPLGQYKLDSFYCH